MDERATHVAEWLAYCFRRFPRWLRWELEWGAKAEGIDLWMWWNHPAVKALGLQQHQHVCPWVGGTAWEMICQASCPGDWSDFREEGHDGDV